MFILSDNKLRVNNLTLVAHHLVGLEIRSGEATIDNINCSELSTNFINMGSKNLNDEYFNSMENYIDETNNLAEENKSYLDTLITYSYNTVNIVPNNLDVNCITVHDNIMVPTVYTRNIRLKDDSGSMYISNSYFKQLEEKINSVSIETLDRRYAPKNHTHRTSTLIYDNDLEEA